MSRFIPTILTIVFLSAAACVGSGTEPELGTESGNPKSVTNCSCETDAQCEGLFDWQIENYNAVVRKVQCNSETLGCRAILEVEQQCYVNLAIESRSYDCTHADSTIFELSTSDPNRPDDLYLMRDECEQ